MFPKSKYFSYQNSKIFWKCSKLKINGGSGPELNWIIFFKAPLTRVSTLKGVDIAVAVAPVFSLVSESGEINMPRKQPKHALHVTVLSITDRIFIKSFINTQRTQKTLLVLSTILCFYWSHSGLASLWFVGAVETVKGC